jgi:hypothetical protein
MATPKTQIDLIELESLAWQYILECINNTKQHPTASGKLVLITDRHLPTISYFLKIWLPMKGKPSISRTTFYNWLNQSKDKEKLDTIKNIEGLFTSLAIDILANDNKGAGTIFYAKNKLGFSDIIVQKNDENFKPIELVVKYSDDIKPI